VLDTADGFTTRVFAPRIGFTTVPAGIEWLACVRGLARIPWLACIQGPTRIARRRAGIALGLGRPGIARRRQLHAEASARRKRADATKQQNQRVRPQSSRPQRSQANRFALAKAPRLL
jgi:hypothetical protein